VTVEVQSATKGQFCVAPIFTYDHYGHLFPETDRDAAAKLDAIRAGGLDGRGAVAVPSDYGRRTGIQVSPLALHPVATR
jgi:hypothetical protein